MRACSSPRQFRPVFANQAGKALDRHNLLHRHVKPVAESLGLPRTIDFRSFRTMHASLMRRFGARLDERVEAVNRIVEAAFAEPDEEEKERVAKTLKGLPGSGIGKQWKPFWEPQAV